MAENEIGNRYGNLLVIEREDNGWDRTSQWKCKCDCGNITIVRGTSLRFGNTRSCGCLAKFPSGDAAFNALYSHLKKDAKKRGHEWDLTKDDVKYFTSQNCFYCGIAPYRIYKRPSFNGGYIYNGIDRVDNTKGYFINNCVPCCWICNRAKGGTKIQEFKEWSINIYEHWSSK